MSTSHPARLSRRTVLRGAATASIVAALATVPGCSGDGGAGGDIGAPSTLLALGRSLAEGPSSLALQAVPLLDLGPVRSDEDVVRAVVDRDVWLLSTTEGAVLVAYAGACPMSAC